MVELEYFVELHLIFTKTIEIRTRNICMVSFSGFGTIIVETIRHVYT